MAWVSLKWAFKARAGASHCSLVEHDHQAIELTDSTDGPRVRRRTHRRANREGPKGPSLNDDQVAKNAYFLAARLTALAGAAAFGTALTEACGATAAGAAFSAVRWSRSAVISALILSLRSVSFAMLLLSFAIALAVLDTGAVFEAGLAVGLATLAGVFTFTGAAALGAGFFAVAIIRFPFYVALAKVRLPVPVL